MLHISVLSGPSSVSTINCTKWLLSILVLHVELLAIFQCRVKSNPNIIGLVVKVWCKSKNELSNTNSTPTLLWQMLHSP